MQVEKSLGIYVETAEISSEYLERSVRIDCYFPLTGEDNKTMDLLLINDGQDLVSMGFENILAALRGENLINPVFCVGIHCGENRMNEYGMISSPDFKGRGARASQYEKFIMEELLPYIHKRYASFTFPQRAFAGFSMGALSALDLVWNHPETFSRVGVFSGSLWWRSKDKNEKSFNEATDRLMHQQVRKGVYHPGMKFFFQCGELDEWEDRNNNGVIDSIDDNIDRMKELVAKGYREGTDFRYLQLPDGKHDVPTWAKAFPEFLKWGWGK